MSNACGPISNYIFILVLVPCFVIVLASVLGIFLVDLNNTIFNESLLKAHTLFFYVFVFLETIHDHVMCKTRVGIADEHLTR